MEDLKLVSSEKCPLCGGNVLLGECSSCGYALPDTEQLSAPYDFDPANVLFGEAAEADDDDDIPTIKAPDASALPTLSQHRQAVRLKKQEEKKAEAENAANKPFVPYTKPNYGESVTPAEPAKESDIFDKTIKVVFDFVACYWQKLILMAIVPSFGYVFAFFYFVINRDKDGDKSELFFAGAILLITIILQALKWDPTGLDIIIKSLFIMIFTSGRHYGF